MFRYKKSLNPMGREQGAVHIELTCTVSLAALLFILFWLLPANIVQADSTLYIPTIRGSPDTSAPSGDFIAYGFNGNLFVVNADGQSAPKSLTTFSDQYAQVAPRWSADNHDIHFWYQSEQDHALVRVPFDGALPMTSISVTLQGDYYLADWSSDGSKALLQHTDYDAEPPQSDIYSIKADGTDFKKLPTESGDKYYVSWSPDGTKIAYHTVVATTVRIYIADGDGSNPIQLAQSLSHACCVVWSPSGNQVAFEHDNNGFMDIYTVDIDGDNLRNLTVDNPDDNDNSPVWSPDGTQIAFVTYRNKDWFLYMMNVDGSNPAPLFPEPGFYQPNIQWSPNGDKIAFVKDFVVGFAASAVLPDIVIPITERDLGVLDIASQTETRLTFREQAPYWYAWSN